MFARSGPDDHHRGERSREPRQGGGRPRLGAASAPRTAAGNRTGRASDRAQDRAAQRGPGKGGVRLGERSGRSRLPAAPGPPVRRVLSIAIAGFSLLLAFGLVIGSQATQLGFTVVVFGAQALFVLAWTVASRPPSPLVAAVVGILTAAASAVAVNIPVDASLTPLGYVIAGAFGAAVVGQLALRGGRAGVTESLGVTMVVVVGVTAFAAYIALSRLPLGDQVLMAGVAAAGIGLATGRICDVLVPSPRIAAQVPRGSTGVVAGAMAGTAAAAVVGYSVEGLTTLKGALAGMVAVLVAVVVDLGTGYAEAGRRLEGEAPFMWLARHMQGPLGAFAFAAPASYVVCVILR